MYRMVMQNNANRGYENVGVVFGNTYKASHNIFVITKNGHNEKNIIITIDSSSYNLKLTLSDESDVFFLYSVTITHEDYLLLKSEQGLLVNFPDFSDQIINLLQQCVNGKIFLQLVMGNSNNIYKLEFIERNDFKNLIHLQLKVFPCEQEEILANITEKLNKYKEKVQNLEKKNDLLNVEVATLMKDNEALCKGITDAEHRIRNENAEIIHKTENEYKKKVSEMESQLLKNMENIQNLNSSIKDLTNTQKTLKTQINQYTTTIENMNREIKRIESELKQSKYQNIQFEDEIRKKEVELSGARTNIAVLEQSLKEKSDVISMLRDTLSRNEKEIEALRSSSAMKSEQELKLKVALQQNTDDLNKANQIIVQTNTNYEQLKKKFTLVSKILVTLEKNHTQLQEEHENNIKNMKTLQNKYDEQTSEFNKMKNEFERLMGVLKTKDENIIELKKLLELQEEKRSKEIPPKPQTVIPTVISEWKPLPSPKTNNNTEIENNSPRMGVLTSCNRINRPLQISNKKGSKFPSSYFIQAENLNQIHK